VRRIAALATAAALVAGCGGGAPAERADSSPASPPAPPAVATTSVDPAEPTSEELEFREQLLVQLESGRYGDCGCTAEARAKERLARAGATP
jgi:hypothetical protein